MLYVEPELMREIIGHAESSSEECCGFLLGREMPGYRLLDEVIAASNVTEQDKKYQFEIDPLEYLGAEKIAFQKNLQLIGIYHSHPDHPAIPSALDKAAALPNFSYVIVSVMDRKFAATRSWRLNAQFFFEEEQIIEKTNTNRLK